MIRFDINRTTTNPTGGTAVTAQPNGPSDTNSGVAVTIHTRPTNVITSTRMFPYVTTTRWSSIGVQGSGMSTSNLNNLIMQETNILMEGGDIKPIIKIRIRYINTAKHRG
jgi:hypothetical protein